MGDIFRFKHFQVDQHGAAMKINTDGVILAAMANIDQSLSAPEQLRFLDIGTGTGVIAMMLAQRFPTAFIDAVEIDEQASLTADANFSNSSFAERLTSIHSDIALFETTHKYDLLISNPPFFVKDLKNMDLRKSIARHTGESFFKSLLQKAKELLTEKGRFWLILPVKQADFLIEMAREFNFHLQTEIAVHSDETRPVIRKIVCLGNLASILKIETFCIYKEAGVHTESYKTLLRDFFLAF